MNRPITREHEIIRQARIRLCLSQQHVATLVSIQIRQYQCLEYGESDVPKLGMRAELSLCIVLELDPYELIFGAHPETVEDLRSRRPAKGNPKMRMEQSDMILCAYPCRSTFLNERVVTLVVIEYEPGARILEVSSAATDADQAACVRVSVLGHDCLNKGRVTPGLAWVKIRYCAPARDML